jgi:coenzyme PQQ precursor peptide PqqA
MISPLVVYERIARGYSGRIAAMKWETPEVEEITLSCEINSYSNAEL